MKILNVNGMELHVSEDIRKEKDFNVGLELYLESVRDCAFSEEAYEEYYKEYSKKTGLSGFGLLLAHGDPSSDWGWKCIDGNKRKSVQSWINENDGKHAGLILICCNEYTKEIHSRKSLVFVPDRPFSIIAFNANAVKYEMYVPKKGYMNNYVVEYELEQLKKWNQSKKI